MPQPKIVFLDAATVYSLDDPDYQGLRDLPGDVVLHELTAPVQILERCQDATAVITNKVPFSADTIAALPDLKLLHISATGKDHIDLVAAEQAGVKVLNVSGYSTGSVAQQTLGFMLMLSLDLNLQIASVAGGDWPSSKMFTLSGFHSEELMGKTLVIVGFGTIGKKVAQLAEAFEMKVIAANVPGSSSSRTSLATALPQADFVSLHCPLTNQTEKMVNAEFLSLMSQHSFLLNTARGGLIDEAALAKAITKDQIAGAALDVLTQEPPNADNPLLAINHPRLLITPHTAWATRQAKRRLLATICEQIGEFLESEKLVEQ